MLPNRNGLTTLSLPTTMMISLYEIPLHKVYVNILIKKFTSIAECAFTALSYSHSQRDAMQLNI